MSIISSMRQMYLYVVNKHIIKTAKSVGARFVNNSPQSCVNSNTVLGHDVSFNGMRIIGRGPVEIGNCFHCSEGCYIITENHDYDNGRTIPYDYERSNIKKTVIEDNVWLGACVIVLPGVRIGEGAIIQAGSVVCSDVPACCIAGGHPARVFKKRDVNHYYSLKEKGAFVINGKN